LADFIAVPDVYPVGRLDYDSEGLLLLTNDGVLQHRLSDPSFAHPRTYWAQVEGLITEEAIEQLRRGVSVQDYRTRPAKAHTIADPPLPPREPPVRFRAHILTSWLELTLTEGRNRQVRRMTAAIGFPTLRLIRVALGPLRLEALSAGSWRDITEAEHQALRSAFQKKGAMDAKKGGRESRPERQFKRVR
jgi:23S rRNA pseudouridine2457 synthase